MNDDPLWIDVTKLLQQGIGMYVPILSMLGLDGSMQAEFFNRLLRIHGIRDIDLHAEEVTGNDKTIEVVVDIFNKVNSGGTKLSGGDLALARLCAGWPDARDSMKKALKRWRDAGYHFSLDWLLRNMNAIVMGEAKFSHLHNITPAQAKDGLHRAEKAIDAALNLLSGRLGLDHDQVLPARGAIPLMAHYIDKRGALEQTERDQLLFWFLQSAMRGRYSGSTESMLDKDLACIDNLDGGLLRLVEEVRLAHGSLGVVPDHFGGWSLGARFYPVLYLLTRTGEAKDWGTGLPLKHGLLGRMNQLEVHHIFPKAQLYKHGYGRAEVNAVANFCFLTKDTNLKISARLPELYFAEVEARHPGTLATQWVPQDRTLWKMENYRAFLEQRKRLLAEAVNALLAELAHGLVTMERDAKPILFAKEVVAPLTAHVLPGGIEGPEEEAQLQEINQWVAGLGLPEGTYLFELADRETRETVAVLDLAWPDGLQAGLSQPVAVLLNEGKATLDAANAQGFRYFTSEADFKAHVLRDVVVGHVHAVPVAAA